MSESKSWWSEHAPGVLLSLGLFTLSYFLSQAAGHFVSGFNPLTPSVLAILSGIVVANLFKPSARFQPGITFCLKKVLRAGIVLIGLRLSLGEVGQLGASGMPVVVAAVVTGVLGIELLSRLFNLPEKLGMLLAAGTSICGVTAVVSTAPVIDADEGEVAYAVANVTLFGLVGTLAYPYLVPYLFEGGKACGLFLGTAIHDMAQCMGAAATYKDLYADEIGFNTTAITKMTRNLFLAAVIPYFAWRARAKNTDLEAAEAKRPPLLPPFLIGFLLMSLVRTVGDATLSAPAHLEMWEQALHFLGKELGSTWFVGVALVGVGLKLKLEIFKGLGFRPFVIGFLGAMLVGFTSFLVISALN